MIAAGMGKVMRGGGVRVAWFGCSRFVSDLFGNGSLLLGLRDGAELLPRLTLLPLFGVSLAGPRINVATLFFVMNYRSSSYFAAYHNTLGFALSAPLYLCPNSFKQVQPQHSKKRRAKNENITTSQKH